MNILTLINNGSDKLKNNKIFSHRLDSEILLSNVLNKKREELLVNLNEKVSVENIKQFQKIISGIGIIFSFLCFFFRIASFSLHLQRTA